MKKFILPIVLSICLLTTLLASYPTSIQSKIDIQNVINNWGANPQTFINTMGYACLHTTGLGSNQATKFFINYGYDPFTNTYNYTKTLVQCSKMTRLGTNSLKIEKVWDVKNIDITQPSLTSPIVYYNSYNTQGLVFLLP